MLEWHKFLVETFFHKAKLLFQNKTYQHAELCNSILKFLSRNWNFLFTSYFNSAYTVFPSWNRIRWQTFYITDQWVWRPDVWHKILEGRWISKTCLYKKSFSKYWVVAYILNFLVHRKYTLSLLWDENFFLWKGSMGIKNPSFYADSFVSLYLKNKFSSLRRNNECFLRTLRPTIRETKNGFYKQVIDFHVPFKILCHTNRTMKFCQLTGP